MKQLRLQWIIPMIAALFVLFVQACTRLLGQATNTGTVVGEVDDQSGAVIAGRGRDPHRSVAGTKLTTATNGTGKYIFPSCASRHLRRDRHQVRLLAPPR